MQARFIRDDIEFSPMPGEKKPPGWQAQTEVRVYRGRERRMWKRGGVVEHPEAWVLVRQGVAEPADEECAAACGMTEAEMQQAQYLFERLRRGIAPEDFERYDRGEIAGYKPDGSEIPGPNWKPPAGPMDVWDDEWEVA